MLVLLSLAALADAPETVPPTSSRGEILIVEKVGPSALPRIASPEVVCTDGACPSQLAGTTYLSPAEWERMRHHPSVTGIQADPTASHTQATWTALPGTQRWAGLVNLVQGVQPLTGRIGGVAPAVRVDGIELLSNEMRTGRF